MQGEKKVEEVKIERSTGKEEKSPQRKRSEVTDQQHHRDIEVAQIQKEGGREIDGAREGGEEQEPAASCMEQTGKALVDSDDERFLRALTSFSELLHKTQNSFF